MQYSIPIDKDITAILNGDGNDISVPKWKYTDEIGLIAQDVKNIPELAICVSGEETDANGTQTPLRINYSMISTYHIAATKELTTQLNAEKEKTALIESKVATLE